MRDLQSKLDYVRDKIRKKIQHPFLSQYIDDPVIDEDKLLFLVSILDYMEMPLAQLENYCVSTMLIQVALDTHEKVENATNTAENTRHRQLTVLAGIYYSGFYYKLLAEQSDVDVIGSLAKGIKTVNDQKIIVYQKDISSIDKLMDSVKKIEFSLVEKIASHFQLNVWDDMISDFLFIRRLTEEKEKFKKSQSSVVFNALRKLVFSKQELSTKGLSIQQQNYLILICDRYIDYAKHCLVMVKDKVPMLNDLVEERMNNMLEIHQQVAKSLVEEG